MQTNTILCLGIIGIIIICIIVYLKNTNSSNIGHEVKSEEFECPCKKNAKKNKKIKKIKSEDSED